MFCGGVAACRRYGVCVVCVCVCGVCVCGVCVVCVCVCVVRVCVCIPFTVLSAAK